jgi:hypothetical protein
VHCTALTELANNYFTNLSAPNFDSPLWLSIYRVIQRTAEFGKPGIPYELPCICEINYHRDV